MLFISAVCGFFSSLESGGFSPVVVWGGLSCGAGPLGPPGCRAQAQRLWHMAYLLCHGLWHLPASGIWPESPALVGAFLTTQPPGKPFSAFWNWVISFFFNYWVVGVPHVILKNNHFSDMLFANIFSHSIGCLLIIAFVKWKWREVKLKSLSRVQLFATSWTVQSMELSRLEFWTV